MQIKTILAPRAAFECFQLKLTVDVDAKWILLTFSRPWLTHSNLSFPPSNIELYSVLKELLYSIQTDEREKSDFY